MGPLNEIVLAFDHLSTQLALIGLKIKVLKFKLWSSSRISLGITNPQCCILIIDGLCIMGVGASMGFQDFVTIFLNEALS
jgi:hypothetical protein